MIHFGKPILDKSERNNLTKVLKSGILTHGPEAENFENDFTKFTKIKYSLTTSSCTSALLLSYMAINLKQGDEFIVPAQTHVATVNAGIFLGGKPIFIDSDQYTGNIDVDLIEKKITKKTKCITIVHYLGKPVEIKKIKKICKKYNLFLIEDCALALGAKYYKKHVGFYSDFACFSFYPAKHITTGDGGMVCCQNKKLFEKLKLLRGFGVDKNFRERKIPGKYDVKSFGLNFRMSDINASIGRMQLKKLPGFLRKRKKNYKELKKLLIKIRNINIIDSDNSKNLTSSHYGLALKLSDRVSKFRDQIVLELKKNNVGSSIYYPRIIPEYSFFKKKYKIGSENFKFAKEISDKSICLPIAPHIKNIDLKKIFYTFNSILNNFIKKNKI
jgi:perosamine synthetase